MLMLDTDSFNFELLPYTQCSATPGVIMMDDKAVFEKRITELNEAISNDAELLASFKKMAKEKKTFLELLEPYGNKYLKLLFAKGLLPSFIDQDKKNILLELFRCEAHCDVMQELLEPQTAETTV